MKILIVLLAVFGTCFSHPFKAETNFKCTLCQEAMKLVQQEDFSKLKEVMELFPKAQEEMGMTNELLDAFVDSEDVFKMAVIDERSVEEMCKSIDMCQNEFEDYVIDTQEHIKTINEMETSWTAGANQKFLQEGLKASDIRQTLGAIVDTDWTIKLPVRDDHYTLSDDELPDTFDSRTQWSSCKELGTVRDQANCGSCWAFGTTEAFNDRRCISGGVNTLLSTADTTGCCGFLQCFSMGCNGGQIATPWSWFKSTGVVTGGQMGDTSTCYPYTMPQCEHHVPGSKPSCADIKQVNPTCSKSCQSGYSTKYSEDKVKSVGASYSVSASNIKKELVEHGPVTGAFTVYEDFLSYKSGVYQHKTGSALGGHAIKLIGYGTEDGLDYLLVMNSWNEDWGDKGLFKIVPNEISQRAAGDVSGTLIDM